MVRLINLGWSGAVHGFNGHAPLASVRKAPFSRLGLGHAAHQGRKAKAGGD